MEPQDPSLSTGAQKPKKSRYAILQEQYSQQVPLAPNTLPPINAIPSPIQGVQPPTLTPTPLQPQVVPPTTGYQPQPVAQVSQAPEPQTVSLDPTKLPNPTRGYGPQDVADKPIDIITYNAQTSELPPRPDSDYIVNDAYNASPRFIRVSTYSFPNNNDLLKSSNIPLSMVIQPFAEVGAGEAPVPLVDMGPDGPIRCNRCRAYINPFVTFTNGGAKYNCGFCGLSNDVPPSYYSPLLGNQRQDIASRVELWRGSVDFVATAQYKKDNKDPLPPTYLFCLETTQRSVQSGMVDTFALALQRLLPALFEDSKVKIGIITFDSTVSFYNIHPSSKRPQMISVPDVSNIFVPLPLSAITATYSESKANIESLLSILPTMYKDTHNANVATGAALKVAAKALSTVGGGKIFLFSCSLPNFGPGALKKRDHLANLETDKEKLLYKPQTEFYTKLSEVCAKYSVAIDMFIGTSGYIDIHTLGEATRATGGQIYYYPSFTQIHHQEELYRELYRNLTRDSAFDTLSRLRCGQGLNIKKDYGHFTKLNETDLSAPIISADSSYAFEFEYDDVLKEDRGALFQMAILYSTPDGYRRIRVHNIKISVTNQINKVFKSADLDTIVNLLARQTVREASEIAMPEVRKKLVAKVCQILASYKKQCSAKGSQRDGQLVLPDSLKLLPIYSLGMLKSPLVGPLRQGTQFHTLADTRSYLMSMFDSMPLSDQAPLLYPLLFEVHTMVGHEFHGILNNENGFVHFPGQCRLSKGILNSSGIYLLDSMQYLYLWIGQNVDSNMLDQVLPQELQSVDNSNLLILPRIETDLSNRIFNLLSSRRLQRSLLPEIYVIRQGSPLEQRIILNLIEDGPSVGNNRDVKDMSYIDYLCHVHRKIQTLL
eukprot:TRINITY_DN5895_c0_g1_i3.p1 TRINITY_DN5895_c0_g1~~TRINITY_DN5895_c0_g1_i3.p1  ORF type:complete len:883 (+),score=236.06 TRINITY_DN5895_c0_g1_i3:49-2697(+)